MERAVWLARELAVQAQFNRHRFRLAGQLDPPGPEPGPKRTDNWERLLFKRRFDKYLAAGGKRPNITECVDYAIAPLVGGGKENLRKMKVSGLEDAVSRAGHQRDKYGAIPPGLRPPG